ncbi:ABC transporter ATP-binding protein/permease [Mariniplasma anaerobium]|uniref:Sulfate ABC transporter ATP-binding protein n=1 Tax=Mariniplasma anaerobium TaxID=2735436 RepID=A0A7U9THN4_9MOLU|nr:ABC transporter ATP-binding protein/permease [Mariniplasma anaerobium]BCR35244.1 sulfate ABC transporter ATP-binding protein [Mariniplasma anaerobium]
MLQLKNIKKDYVVAGLPIPALSGITLEFQKNEFVSILGASGSGKTTLLNIIGGLDRYTSGDLLVEGKSTKEFSNNDWDAYRNATIGFVFQTYNLISHLSVLDNVEMALRLSGVSSKERKERATKVLVEVGLADHIHKKPNQLSGGQMQRVAIARALVNNPKILLADEPSGALDSKTSIQILKLIKDISKDRLVIMVTHNTELAQNFSDRIVQLVDGRVVEDSRPVHIKKENLNQSKLLNKKTSMSYMTALKTSFKNLLTKKGRTLITAVAGSIGIIGIALVLSISSGMTNYVDDMQSDTLAGFPLTISSVVSTDAFADPAQRMGDLTSIDGSFTDEPIIYSYDEENNTTLHTNIVTDDFLDYLNQMDSELYNSISYTRAISLNIVAETSAGGYTKVVSSQSNNPFTSAGTVLNEIPNSPEFIQSQYDILDGVYPTAYNELVLIVDSQNQIDVSVLESLGISIEEDYTFSDFIGKTFKVIPNDLYYTSSGSTYIPETNYDMLYNSTEAITISIVGILRVSEDASTELLSSGIGYTTFLTDYMIDINLTSDIVVAQEASKTLNVLTGQPFNTQLTYDIVMRTIGGDSAPTGVQIYPVSFDSKDLIKDYLDAYNVGLDEVDSIIYTDLAETISSTISTLISTITIILAAFAGISLVVSSIMIGIITYVSVIERTKEIGIMRSLGARKKDISRIFNAETVLIGFTSGVLGVLIAMVLNIPLNMIINGLIGVTGFSTLTLTSSLSLIVLSTILTLVAGLIPSGIAARKDPVVALRTE